MTATKTNTTPRQRRSRGQAWHWKQTDAWYYTPPGTKQRVLLRDESGRSIRGSGNRPSAELALARIKVSDVWRPTVESKSEDPWLVAKVCSLYIESCEQRAANGNLHPEYRAEVIRYLNRFTEYCGALPVSELRKGHIHHWIESQPTWKSTATQRNAMTVVLSAFHHARENWPTMSKRRAGTVGPDRLLDADSESVDPPVSHTPPKRSCDGLSGGQQSRF